MLRDQTQPPWAWYQYMKLQEATESVLKATNSVEPFKPTTEHSLQLATPQGNVVQLAAAKSQRDKARSRHDTETPQMPM